MPKFRFSSIIEFSWFYLRHCQKKRRILAL